MGCLGAVLAALLALAVPASIAPASLVGAYVVILLLAAAAAGFIWQRLRRRADRADRMRAIVIRLAVLVVAYGVVVTVIHALT